MRSIAFKAIGWGYVWLFYVCGLGISRTKVKRGRLEQRYTCQLALPHGHPISQWKNSIMWAICRCPASLMMAVCLWFFCSPFHLLKLFVDENSSNCYWKDVAIYQGHFYFPPILTRYLPRSLIYRFWSGCSPGPKARQGTNGYHPFANPTSWSSSADFRRVQTLPIIASQLYWHGIHSRHGYLGAWTP